jgi:pyruvate-ferredoxin/flavodoxin oxidoreductase
MVKGIFDEMTKEQPKNHFTIGINDDVSNTSLDFDPCFLIESEEVIRSVFFGLGSDGTVGGNKNSIKIIGDQTENYAQGYFVYDSKKAGAKTISHLRFGPEPIRAPYIIEVGQANFVACHQFSFLEQIDMLKYVAPGGTFLLNSIYGPEEIWENLPLDFQQAILEKEADFYIVDAYKIAEDVGLGTRINTVMQTCFFALSGVLPKDRAIKEIKAMIKKSYGKKGEDVVKMNNSAVDQALENMHKIDMPAKADSTMRMRPPVPEDSPDFVKNVIGTIIKGEGDSLPVSAFSEDGTFPVGTTQYEKRNIALEIPQQDLRCRTSQGCSRDLQIDRCHWTRVQGYEIHHPGRSRRLHWVLAMCQRLSQVRHRGSRLKDGRTGSAQGN